MVRKCICLRHNLPIAFFDKLSKILHASDAKIDKYLYMESLSMKYRAKVEVRLKPGHSDPEGETTKQSLAELSYSVLSVGAGKVYEIVLEARSLNEAKKIIDEICRRLLANPVKDNYIFEIEVK